MSDQMEAAARERDRLRKYFSSGSAAWHRWSRGRHWLAAERRRLLERLAERVLSADPADLTVCDVGCGDGGDLAAWRELGVPASGLAGTEITPSRAVTAAARVPGADIREVGGFKVPFPDGAFRLTTAALVLSAVADAGLRRRLFGEMWRVTATGGAVAVYDFRVRKPWNRSVVALTRGRARTMAGGDPDLAWPAAPLLPALDLVLRLPRAVRAPLIRLVPRTHVVYLWRR